MKVVLWLDELDRNAVAEAGGKGANLGEMLRAGLPVPPGFVVTAAAYQSHLTAAGLRERIAARLRGLPADLGQMEAAGADAATWILAAPAPVTVTEAVKAAYRDLAARLPQGSVDPAVAVRSSATAEDSTEASFAGQHETYLNVRGEEAVLAALQRCWGGLWEPRALAYRARRGYDHLAVSLAVVIQAMVPADVAGVMFTANQVGGTRREFVVSASYGLGEAVVGGLVTPDNFLLAPGGRVLRRTLGTKQERILPAPDGTRAEDVSSPDRARYCLRDAELAALAALGRQVIAHFGAPQDTEWALAGGRLYLLQSRPITTVAPVPRHPEAAPKAGRLAPAMRDNLIDRFPEPLTPLDMTVAVPVIFSGILGMLADLGFRVPRAEQLVVELADGRFVLRPWAPRPRLPVLWRLPARLLRALREDPAAGWAPVARDLAEALRRSQATPLERLDATELVAHLGQVTELLETTLIRRFRALLPGLIHEPVMHFWLRRAVGRAATPGLSRQLYLDLPYRTALMNRAVARIAAEATASGRESPAFAAALEGFLAEWGDRPARGMEPAPSFPTWREDPRPVLGLVDALQRDAQSRDSTGLETRQAEQFASARARVASRLGALGRRCFLYSLERARHLVLAREDSLFALEKGIAWMRRLLLALGDRLAEAGVLVLPDDVFFLTASELPEATRAAIDVRERVDRRRKAYARICRAHEAGENWLVAAGTLPPPPRLAPGHGKLLTGLPCGNGRATGPVCIVHGPADFAKLHRGDILVCPATAPAWTPLFGIAGALVTDVGSPLSHAAIVAREYGLPAVVATGRATTTLRDGQWVTVNGDAGWVAAAEQ